MVLANGARAEHLAEPPVIRALRDPVEVSPSAETRALLKAARTSPSAIAG